MTPTKKKPECPPATLNGAQWISSDARKLMAQDTLDGCTPLEGPVDPEEIYHRLCHNHAFFANFPFDKIRHDARLKTLRNQVRTFKKWATHDDKALQADRQTHPFKKDIRGNPRWEGSEAQALLKEDVKNKVHENMTPQELRLSREACQHFTVSKFRKHLDQAKQDEKAHVDNGHRHSKNGIGDANLSRITI